MEDKQILLDNISKVHTTEMGMDRIKKNLKLNTNDVVEFCKNKILDNEYISNGCQRAAWKRDASR